MEEMIHRGRKEGRKKERKKEIPTERKGGKFVEKFGKSNTNKNPLSPLVARADGRMNPLSPAGMRLTYQVIHSSPKPSKSGNFGPMGFFFLPQPTWPNRPMATARLNLFNFLISE